VIASQLHPSHKLLAKESQDGSMENVSVIFPLRLFHPNKRWEKDFLG
jgi:hypothetical protein